MVTRFLTAAFLASAFAGPALADLSVSRENARLLVPFRPVVAKANESTVRVRCNDKDAALGTVVAAKGLILTKASELNGKVTCRLFDGTEYEAVVLAVHKKTDLALIKIDVDGLRPVTFEDTKKVPVGNWLAASGTQSDPLAVGIVSVATRSLSKREDADAFNANRGFLNVRIRFDPDTKGTKIYEVLKDGAAAKAGLKTNDVIAAVGGREVRGEDALREILDAYRPDDVVTLKVTRGEETLTLKVKLAHDTSPQNREDIQNQMGSELSGRRRGFSTVLQTDMVLEPKNCGGPIVDLEGRVLGISIARAGRVETWVLPSEAIRPVLTEMRAGQHPVAAAVKK